MSKNDAKERLSISFSIMLPMEMTRAALRLIEGSDLPWGQADITAEPVREGCPLFVLQRGYSHSGFYEYKDATNDEVLRTIHIKGCYLGHGGFVQFESKCELRNYRSMWEPRIVDVRIGDINRHFYYINEWREDRYNSKITESSPAVASA